MLLAFLIIIPFVAFVFYIRAISKALSVIEPAHRKQAPGMAWLLLIPVFNVIWFFFLLKAIREGFEQMLLHHQIEKPIDTGYSYGIGMGCCWAASFIPGLFFIALLPMFVFSMLHWTKLNQARRQIFTKISPQ